jgi:hypothetical protein
MAGSVRRVVIRTHVKLDGVTTVPYKANEIVGEDLLRSTVVSLARIGRCCFPQVYSVIHDTEGDSGLRPVVPMEGEGAVYCPQRRSCPSVSPMMKGM